MSEYRRDSPFIVLSLQILASLSDTNQRLEEMVNLGAVRMCVKCMKKHKRHAMVWVGLG